VKLRKHQLAAQRIAADIAAGLRDDRIITAYVTPGGGKTLMASLFAHGLLAGDAERRIERVLVVCPRLTLQAQMAKGFRAPLVGCEHGLSIGYQSTRSLLRDDLLGSVTTYQELVADAERGPRSRWLRFSSELPTLVVLDEAHHLLAPGNGAEDKEEEGWTRAVAPLVAVAHRVLVMTGTPKRSNGTPIAFVDYAKKPSIFDIEYPRLMALDEQAIINVSVKLCDGKAAYWHRFSQHEHDLSSATGKEESRALRTLLQDSVYRNRVIDEALKEFAAYRSTRYPDARMIIIAANQDMARSIARHLRETTSWRPVLAISDEKGAHSGIAKFRDHGDGDILVTVQMAHEGLDVPNCTHLVALTAIRKTPWLDQALSRCTRFDTKCKLPWQQQQAFLYVPNDHTMSSFLREWIKEQDPTPDTPSEGGSGHAPPRGTTFSPISGEMTRIDYADTYGVYSHEDQDRLRRFDLDESIDPSAKVLPAAVKLQLARRMWPGLEVVK